MVPSNLIKFYIPPSSLRKYKWHPGYSRVKCYGGTPSACGFIRGTWITCHSIDVSRCHRWFPVVMLVGVNKHFWCRCQGRHMLKNLFKFGKISMVSGQWSGRTTMLSSFCVKTGLVSEQFQFANEFHNESESTSRQAWFGTLDFEKSTLQQLGWSWLHPPLEKAQILCSKKCSIVVAWSPTAMNTASTEKATTLWCNPGK